MQDIVSSTSTCGEKSVKILMYQTLNRTETYNVLKLSRRIPKN
ncbi:hypothetical protein [Spiroplasma endosymbiont of Virgichneumon dumeticola]